MAFPNIAPQYNPNTYTQSPQQFAPWAISPYLGQAQTIGNAMGWSNPLQKPAAPGSPDFKGAAEATAAGNIEQAKLATQANRPTQVNPFGTSTWIQNPDGTWSQNVSFSPEQQALYGATTQGKQNLLSSQLPSFGENRQNVINAMMGRVTQDISRQRDQVASDLTARGIPRGSPAWNAEMDQLDRQYNDARQQAEISATQQAGQEYGANLAGRGQQIGMYSAWTPTSPAFNQFYNQQAIPGTDYLGASQQQAQWDLGQYNQQMAQRNALLQGLFQVGAAYAGA